MRDEEPESIGNSPQAASPGCRAQARQGSRLAASCRYRHKRHTFASRLVMGGEDLRTVQGLLGHRTMSMTLRYSHLSPEHRSKAVAILDRGNGVHLVTTSKGTCASGDAKAGHQGGHQRVKEQKKKAASA